MCGGAFWSSTYSGHAAKVLCNVVYDVEDVSTAIKSGLKVSHHCKFQGDEESRTQEMVPVVCGPRRADAE